MKFSQVHPMEKNFIFGLRKMVSQKSDLFQDEFFRRIHIVNDYLNEAGTTFHDYNTAAGIALQMDTENIWGEDARNE